MTDPDTPFGIRRAVQQPVSAAAATGSAAAPDSVRTIVPTVEALRRGAETDSRAMNALVRLLDEKAELLEELARIRAERDHLATALADQRRTADRHRNAMLEVLEEVEAFRQRRLALPAPKQS